MDRSLRYAALTLLVGAGLVSSRAAAQPVTAYENFQRMEWEVGHGVGIDLKNPEDPLVSSGFSIDNIPLTPGVVPIFGLPSLDLSARIESPANSFVSDTRERIMGRINLLSWYIDVHNSGASEGMILNYIKFSPEFSLFGTKQSDLQVYGGGSVSHGVFTSGSNSQFKERFGFMAGSDYLITAGAECMFEITPHISIGAGLDGIFPGVNDKFTGHLELGPRFLFNSSNHGMMVSPYFMLNGFSASEKDIKDRISLPIIQIGANISYRGFERFGLHRR